MKKILIAILFISFFNSNAQWAQASGMTGITAWSMGYKGADIWAGTQNGTYKSTDGGASFSAAKTGIPNNTAVWEIITLGNKLIAGTTIGVYISTDDGANWSASNNGLTNTGVISMVESGGNLFAGTSFGGVFISTDGGANWSAASTGLTNNNVRSLVAIGTTIYAGTNNGLFASTNNGSSWTSMSTGFTTSNTEINTLAVNGGTMYVGTNNGGDIYFSTDNGANWTMITNTISCNSIYDLRVSGGVILGAADQGFLSSASSGSNCVYNNTGLASVNVRSSLVLGNYVYAGTTVSGVHRRLLSDFGITASVKENDFSGEFTMYPNPSKGNIKVSLSNWNTATVTLTVMDVLSKKIFSEKLSQTENEIHFRNALPPGIYFVQLSEGQNKITKKLVIE
jgi:hypothetical protein